MERKEFLCRTLQLSLGSCGLAALAPAAALGSEDGEPNAPPDESTIARMERDFVRNWISDLLDTAEESLPREAVVRLMEGCGRGCFRRHEFKRAIAEKGKGDLDRLLQAYKTNFEVWREGNDVHVRYGETSKSCYCPVVRTREPRPNDVHCECTRSTHQSIFETALGRPIRVEVKESLRRGGKTCHFVAHLA
jgi:hypothetical protein